MRFAIIIILQFHFYSWIPMGKTGTESARSRAGFSAQCLAQVFQPAPEYGRRCQSGCVDDGWAITGVGILLLAFAMLITYTFARA